MTMLWAEKGGFVGVSIVEYLLLGELIEDGAGVPILPLDVIEGYYKIKHALKQANMSIIWDKERQKK